MLGRTIAPGSTNQSTVLRVLDADNSMQPVTDLTGASVSLQIYARRIGGDFMGSIFDGGDHLTSLSSPEDDWVAGGFVHLGLGCYRFDIPDSMLAANAYEVVIFATVAGSNYVIEPVVHPLGVNGMPRVNKPAGKPYVLRMSDGSDGTVHAQRRVRIGVNDRPVVALDLSGIYPDQVVASVGTPVITPSGELVVTALGPRDCQGMVQLGGGQQAGRTYKVDVLLTMEEGEPKEATFYVDVKTPPST